MVGLPIKEMYNHVHKAPFKEKMRMTYFIISLVLIMGIENSAFWELSCLVLNLLYSWNAFSNTTMCKKLIAEIEGNDNTDLFMNETEKKSLHGLFQGANLVNPQIVIAESGAKVVYKEVVANKDEKPQVTDEQVANAIRAINGKNKPLDNYQRWLGACCLLAWKYDYPRNIGDCCQRINTLGINDLEFECKYENIRKLTTTNKFVKEDARYWDSYIPKENERKLFNECLLVAQALDAEIQKQMIG